MVKKTTKSYSMEEECIKGIGLLVEQLGLENNSVAVNYAIRFAVDALPKVQEVNPNIKSISVGVAAPEALEGGSDVV